MATAQEKNKKNLKEANVYKTICGKLQYVVETTYICLLIFLFYKLDFTRLYKTKSSF